jgi:Tfp pilus assembly protein PilN
MRAVNLLPSEPSRRRKKIPSGQVLLAGLAPLVAGTLVYLGFSFEQAKVSSARADLGVAQTELAGLRPVAAAGAASTQLASQRTQRLLALQDALGRRVAWDRILDQVARVLPANVWLTQFNAMSPTPTTAAAPPPAPTTTTSSNSSSSSSSSSSATNVVSAAPSALFTLTGYAYSHDDVAHLLARLALVPNLTDVTLGATSSATVGAKAVIQFTVNATMQGGRGS